MCSAYFSKYLQVQLLDHIVSLSLALYETAKLPSQVPNHFPFPSTMNESSWFFPSFPTFGAVTILELDVLSHYCFHLKFTDHMWWWIPFCMLICVFSLFLVRLTKFYYFVDFSKKQLLVSLIFGFQIHWFLLIFCHLLALLKLL